MTDRLEGHTVHRYDGDLHHLHVLTLEMGGLALEQTRAALEAFRRKDLDVAARILERDREINELEVRIDEEIVTLLARRGPVASDLRVVVSTSKMVTDLERIGDEAAKVASQTIRLYENPSRPPGEEIVRDVHEMGALVFHRLEEALTVLDDLDGERAEQVALGGGDLDAEFRSCLRRLSTFVIEDPRTIGHSVTIVLLVKALERIGDHARNLAEQVVFVVSAEDVRHRLEPPKARARDLP